MSCPDPIDLSRGLAEGLDDALRAHVATCASCAAELEAHTAITAAARRLPVFQPSATRARDLRASLLTAARASLADEAPASLPGITPLRRRSRTWVIAAGGALAAAAVLVLVVLPRGSSATYRGSIHAHAGATYTRTSSSPDEVVRLTDGTIDVEVAALSPGERFRVVTGDGEVEVRGTAFDVVAENDHLRAVHVVHGRVEVRADGAAPRVLTAGQEWELHLAAAPSDAPASVATNAPTTKPGTAPSFSATASATKPGTDHGFQATASGQTGQTGQTGSTGSTARDGGPSASATPSTSRTSPTSTTTRTSPAPATPSISTGTKSGVATAAKRPIEVLFERGWAELAAGDARAAAATFDQATKAAPDDPLAEDAWFWRASALARAKDGGAAGALQTFLGRYPRSPRAGEASAMLGWLVIDRELDRAEALFRAAAKDRVPAVRASGEKGLAAVAQRRAH